MLLPNFSASCALAKLSTSSSASDLIGASGPRWRVVVVDVAVRLVVEDRARRDAGGRDDRALDEDRAGGGERGLGRVDLGRGAVPADPLAADEVQIQRRHVVRHRRGDRRDDVRVDDARDPRCPRSTRRCGRRSRRSTAASSPRWRPCGPSARRCPARPRSVRCRSRARGRPSGAGRPARSPARAR